MLLSTDRSSIDITPEGPGLSVLFCTPLIRRDTGGMVVEERACARSFCRRLCEVACLHEADLCQRDVFHERRLDFSRRQAGDDRLQLRVPRERAVDVGDGIESVGKRWVL